VKIDAHQHFWNPARGDYGWMPKDDPVLTRPYGPADLWPQLQSAGVDGTVLVQAAPTVQETEYMLGIADATPWVLGVVGWVDFENRDDLRHLERLANHPKFKGVRPMIQDIPDDDWMLRPDIAWAFDAIRDLGLRFDALGFPRHLDNVLKVLNRHPDMPVVIDHCMKPQIRDRRAEAFSHWAEGMSRIADGTAAVCKFSALVTEADPGVGAADLHPYAEHILSVFGPERVMWGSDWPVCRLRCEYADWHTMAQELTAPLSDVDRALIFGGTAAGFYGL
jgi:L-fuconolactonase